MSMCPIRTSCLLSVILVAGIVGCRPKPRDEREPPKSAPSTLPEKLVFKGSGGTQATGAADWGSCRAEGTPKGLEVSCDSSYAYTLQVGEQRFHRSEKDRWQSGGVKIDVVTAFGNLPVEASTSAGSRTVEFKGIDPKTVVKVAFADGKSVEGALVPFDYPMPGLLLEATKKPLHFDADEPPRQTHSILYFLDEETISHAWVLGPAERLRDVDWVVVRVNEEVRDGGRACSGYTVMGGGGPEKTFPLELRQATISLRDRRTGTEISSKTFVAPKKCPEVATRERAISGIHPRDEVAWMRTQLKM